MGFFDSLFGGNEVTELRMSLDSFIESQMEFNNQQSVINKDQLDFDDQQSVINKDQQERCDILCNCLDDVKERLDLADKQLQKIFDDLDELDRQIKALSRMESTLNRLQKNQVKQENPEGCAILYPDGTPTFIYDDTESDGPRSMTLKDFVWSLNIVKTQRGKVYAALQRNGIENIDDLRTWDYDSLTDIPWIGGKTANIIMNAYKELEIRA